MKKLLCSVAVACSLLPAISHALAVTSHEFRIPLTGPGYSTGASLAMLDVSSSESTPLFTWTAYEPGSTFGESSSIGTAVSWAAEGIHGFGAGAAHMHGIESGANASARHLAVEAVPEVTPVPVPGSILLFGSALLGLAGLGRVASADQ